MSLDGINGTQEARRRVAASQPGGKEWGQLKCGTRICQTFGRGGFADRLQKSLSNFSKHLDVRALLRRFVALLQRFVHREPTRGARSPLLHADPPLPFRPGAEQPGERPKPHPLQLSAATPRIPEAEVADRAECQLEVSGSLLVHQIEAQRLRDRTVRLVEKELPGAQGRKPEHRAAKPVPLVPADRPLDLKEAAGRVTQKRAGGTLRRDTCWVMSGLYALMTSEVGASLLHENVKFGEDGAAVVRFPGYGCEVRLRQVVPLDLQGHALYSDSDDAVELVVRAVDILRQALGLGPVQELGEPEFLLQAFGLRVQMPKLHVGEAERSLKDIYHDVEALLTQYAGKLPVTILKSEHIVAVTGFDAGRDMLTLFNPARESADERLVESLLSEYVDALPDWGRATICVGGLPNGGEPKREGWEMHPGLEGSFDRLFA